MASTQVFSQTDDVFADMETEAEIDEEFEWLKEEAAVTFVITASRVREDIRKSASSISVIKEEQIRQMGARNLSDVLRTVPGVSVRNGFDGNYKIEIRGIGKTSGQHVLLMLNSHPLNESFQGGAIWIFDTMVVDNIKRVEIIRGPGSAMYGANAFGGVVNVITKQAQDVDGCQVSAKTGSYDMQEYNLLFGKQWNDFGITFNLNYYGADAYEGHIEQDMQTKLDYEFGSLVPGYVPVSLSPGNTRGNDEKYDAALTLSFKGLRFDGRYVERTREPPLSLFQSLNDASEDKMETYYLNLGYEQEVTDGLSLSAKIYRNFNLYDSDYQLLPPGGAFPLTDGSISVLPDGMMMQPVNKNIRTGVELQATWELTDSNTLVAGGTYEAMKQYGVEYVANFLVGTYVPAMRMSLIEPLSSMEDVASRQNYNKNVERKFQAFFIQDIWDIWDDLRLTAGLRYDNYDDFGDSLNPRVGIVWEFIRGYDLKLLYGRAFRAPSFYELYTENNLIVWGNEDLKPEVIDTYEISLGATPISPLNIRLTGFYNTIKDNIGQTFNRDQNRFEFNNLNEITSQGIEVEVRYDFDGGSYLGMNYTYQHAKNEETDERLSTSPLHKGNIMANIRLSETFNFYTDFYFQEGFARRKRDHREEVSGFGIINATLIAKDFIGGFKGLLLRGSVYNLLDEDYSYPSSLAGDFPAAGRSFTVELQYRF